MPTVAQIAGVMETLAPRRLAENWDNVGLQVGDPLWPVEKIWLALDPLPEVVAAAAEERGAHAHHPPPPDFQAPGVFGPVHAHRAGPSNGPGKSPGHFQRPHQSRQRCRRGQRHPGPAHRSGIDRGVEPREDGRRSQADRLRFPKRTNPALSTPWFRPGPAGSATIRAAPFAAVERGTFVPGPQSTPYRGRPGEPARIDEVRIETRVDHRRLPAVLAALRKAHPYETVAFDLVPCCRRPPARGWDGWAT